VPAEPSAEGPREGSFGTATLGDLENLPTYLKSGTVGGSRGWGKAARDFAPLGHVLTGFDYTVRNVGEWRIISSLQPIYSSPAKVTRGQAFGNAETVPETVVAKPGYAVAAIEAKGGAVLDGFQLVFMKQRNGVLDPQDSYRSEWIGGPGGDEAKRLSGEGRPIAGLLLMVGKDINQIAVVVRKTDRVATTTSRTLVP
jgi:hypothetical protein